MLIVGLGNPGKEYEDTFHNCGFRVLDALAEKVGKKPSKIECSALTCVTQIGGQKVVLAKPLTYMNNSGEAVKGLLTKYGMKPQDMIVIYDDIDIPRYTVRVRLSGSAGTHNGMKSVISHLGTSEFPRVRIGTGPVPENTDLISYVLADIPKDVRLKVYDSFTEGCIACEDIVNGKKFNE